MYMAEKHQRQNRRKYESASSNLILKNRSDSYLEWVYVEEKYQPKFG